MKKLLLAIVVVLSCVAVNAQTSGPTLPAVCALGATHNMMSVTPNLPLFCSATNIWTLLAPSSRVYDMADAVAVDLFTVALPTSNTGCGLTCSFSYTATNGTTTGTAHGGLVNFSFVNQNGTVTSDNNTTGEAVSGTGCGAGCDTWTSNVVSTSATGRANFNNTLSVVGKLSFRILNTTCPSVVLVP